MVECMMTVEGEPRTEEGSGVGGAGGAAWLEERRWWRKTSEHEMASRIWHLTCEGSLASDARIHQGKGEEDEEAQLGVQHSDGGDAGTGRLWADAGAGDRDGHRRG